MRRFPAEFADLLTRAGAQVLAGRHPESRALADPKRRFLVAQDWIDRRQAAGLRRLLERALRPHLVEMARPIPPEAMARQRRDYGETLPKTSRVLTAYCDSARGPAWRAAAEIGLVGMMRSESWCAFAQALAGRPLSKRPGLQVLRYRPGDYAGPHNDHHPESARARDGYVDMHLSFASPGVAHHFMVYARAGHFSEMAALAGPATITAYRLPFWHMTTPLVARPGARGAARWVLLGTFLYAGRRA